MVLKATLQKKGPIQPLPKVTLEEPVCRFSLKEMLLEISKISQGNICVGVFTTLLQALQPVTVFKRDFNTGISLKILQNFYKQLFL